jgi:GNAT superfamily N-acetyltransferase
MNITRIGGEINVCSATPDRWDDLVDLFERPGPRGGTPVTRGCWCQYWHLRGKAYDAGWPDANRPRMEKEVRGGEEPGLLAYVQGVPVGWCRFGPRETFERLEHAPTLARIDDEPVCSVVCFYVHPSGYRQGIAPALLEEVIAQAAARGVKVLEGYPVKRGHPTIDSYTGRLPMFLAAGFEPVREAGRRTIVRRMLGRSAA